jgi:glycosyltransferase involved in cell wall biosynthesis
LLADWCWQQIPRHILFDKKVLVTVHHIVPEKFGPRERMEFEFRDQFVTAYHVPNVHTETFVKCLTSKPVHLIPYWANQRIWRPAGTKNDIRKRYKLPEDGFLVGSFQRDTEGHDLKSPKLEKGPDLLADALEKFKLQMPKLHVVLGGWRRQYLINRLNAASIPYTYFEKPPQYVINDLYQALDIYPITARYEGGPQSLIECGLLNIPVVSRDVGMATQLLPSSAINNNIVECIPAVPNVEHLKLPKGYVPYRQLIEAL